MQQRPEEFIQVKLNANTLKRLIAANVLHLDELRMSHPNSQRQVRRLLLDSVQLTV